MSKLTQFAAFSSGKITGKKAAIRIALLFALAAVAAGPMLAAPQTIADEPTAPSVSKAQHPRKHPQEKAPMVAVQPVPVAAPEPEAPHWPANDTPTPATVTWDSHGLLVNATNSSLAQILHDISIATGTKVDGFSNDQRVFGSYGPGQARDILAQLLQGSGYNVLMIGDQGQGTPREILLSSRNTVAPPNPNKAGAPGDEDDADVDEPVLQPVAQPDQQRPNGIPTRTPQQMMQEMQQRQQQMGQRGFPQNTPPTPPN